MKFQLISFADLKKHRFIYWFGFPALSPSKSVLLEKMEPLSERLSTSESGELRVGLQSLRMSALASVHSASRSHHPPFFLIVRGGGDGGGGLTVRPLSAWQALSAEEKEGTLFGFVDPSGMGKHGFAPGWPLRNFLVLLSALWGLSRVTVVSYRGTIRRLDIAGAFPQDADAGEDDAASVVLTLQLGAEAAVGPAPRCEVGWEPNARGKMGARQMDLSKLMDEHKLAESSADLNLKLMRWRAIPALDTDMLQSTRCLLLGAGTLGCGVARTLLGWGIRHITFVDNGNVSYSNPVRQNLFEFADCANGGKPKAQAAADALKRIFPSVTTTGHTLTISMPGHSVETELEEAEAAATKLDQLVREHDVVFLLTDTRESRWLPSLLCATHDRCLIDVSHFG